MGARYSIAARAYDLGKGQPATIDAVDLRDNTVDYTGGNETRNEWRDTNGKLSPLGKCGLSEEDLLRR